MTDNNLSLAWVVFMALACCLISAGSYFVQPLTLLISQDLALRPWMAGLLVTLGQLGFCLGLLLVAPLGDLLENRQLLVLTLLSSAVAMVIAATANQVGWFLLACLIIGISSTAVQLIVTFAARLSSVQQRGQTLGRVTGGLLLGALLAWPLANLVAEHWGWRRLFWGEAIAILTLAVLFYCLLPQHHPVSRHRYGHLIGSLPLLWQQTNELRARAYLQALLFMIFSLFWTSAPLLLKQHYGITSSKLAAFGLTGVAGALSAPIAGYLADRQQGKNTALLGLLAIVFGLFLVSWGGALWAIAIAAMTITAGVQVNHVVSQRRILSLNMAAASRINSLYIAAFFLGGALGSALSVPLYGFYWRCPALFSELIAVLALFYWGWQRRYFADAFH